MPGSQVRPYRIGWRLQDTATEDWRMSGASAVRQRPGHRLPQYRRYCWCHWPRKDGPVNRSPLPAFGQWAYHFFLAGYRRLRLSHRPGRPPCVPARHQPDPDVRRAWHPSASARPWTARQNDCHRPPGPSGLAISLHRPLADSFSPVPGEVWSVAWQPLAALDLR